MFKLCLGTAQFGMKYGINNQIGRQPRYEEIFQIMDYAISQGIEVFDTASVYGQSEKILGEYIKARPGFLNKVSFISKLAPNIVKSKDNIYKNIKTEVEMSLSHLGISRLKGFLLHEAGDIYNQAVIEALLKIKSEGLIENIGVSIYDMIHGEAAIKAGCIDYIQLPYSVLDQRGEKEGFFKRAHLAGITIFIRSAFLQGLLLMEPDKVPDYLSEVKPYLERLDFILKKYGYTRYEGAVGFVKNCSVVSYIVFGVDTKKHLEKFLNTYKNIELPTESIKEIQDEININNKNILFPFLWKK